jgi:hypothetical protein
MTYTPLSLSDPLPTARTEGDRHNQKGALTMMKQRIAGLSDAAVAAEVKRVLLDELAAEDKVYGNALMQELIRRFNERRV